MYKLNIIRLLSATRSHDIIVTTYMYLCQLNIFRKEIILSSKFTT